MLELIGWTGAGLVLGAYLLLSMQRLHADKLPYHLINIVGGLLLGIYSYAHGAYASIAINGAWVMIGAVAGVRISRKQ